MAVTMDQARGQIVAELGGAIVQIGFSVACLGAAYELLDEINADRLEAELFRPAQRALGRAKRANSRFATDHGLSAPDGEIPEPVGVSEGVKSLVERSVTAAAGGSRRIAELQDSMLPIEAGDPELRAALAEVRELVDGLAGPAREFLRTLGR